MSKDKNTLHPAFYKMMDFFLDKNAPMSRSVMNLADRRLIGFNMPTYTDLAVEENKMRDSHGLEVWQLLNQKKIEPSSVPNLASWTLYWEDHCRSQYKMWQDSLKMQFETQTLHKYLPKNTSLVDFFSDVQFRMPHENTLLIQQYDKNRVVFIHVTEESAKSFKKNLKPTNTVNKFDKSHPNQIFKSWNLGRKDTVYTAKISVYTNINIEEVLNRHEHDPLDIQALTKPLCFSLPVSYSLPAGYSIKKTSGLITPLPSSLCTGKDGDPLVGNGLGYFGPMFFPEFYKKWTGKLLFNKKEMSDGFEDNYSTQSGNNPVDGYMRSYLMLVLSAMSHMSIYGHPDFKAFCVRQLKKEGLTPMQLSYHEGKPFSKINQKPKYEHYLLDLTIPTESDDHTDGKAGKKRFHLVRGHMMRTPDGGFTWRKSHWRGNRKLGVITKDYNIKIDKRIKKEAQAS